jgi:hypothetical protein
MEQLVKSNPSYQTKICGTALLAAALLASGCGRVSATQTSLSASPLGNPASDTRTYKGGTGTTSLGKVSLTSGGPGNLHGRVLDVSQRGVAGAVVVITETGQRVTTDARGNFMASGLPEGNYTFSALAAGLKQTAPTGVLVQASQDAAVPDILLAPGTGGASGITSITYTQDGAFGDVGQPPGTLLSPLGVAVRGTDVMVLDANHSGGVKTGVIRQYGDDGKFQGKFGDYTHWLGLSMMKDGVTAIAADSQGRTWVLDGGGKQLWRFKADGGKDKQATLNDDAPTSFAIDPIAGTIFVADSGSITKFDGEAGNPQKLANSVGAKALAVGKDGLWALAGNKLQKLGADGAMVQEFGAGGVDKQDSYQDAVALAIDPRNGDLIVADRGSKNVYVYDASGVPIGKIGQGVFLDPVAVTVDATGRVFVTDAGKKKIYKFISTHSQ